MNVAGEQFVFEFAVIVLLVVIAALVASGFYLIGSACDALEKKINEIHKTIVGKDEE